MLGRYGIDAPGVVGAVLGTAAGGGLLTLAAWGLRRHRGQYANSPLVTLENARREGVLPRVACAAQLGCPIASPGNGGIRCGGLVADPPQFAGCASMANGGSGNVSGTQAGGRLAIFDIAHVDDYVETLNRSGAQTVAISRAYFLFALPGRIVSAMKPCRGQRQRCSID